jgi:hypothetical protein
MAPTWLIHTPGNTCPAANPNVRRLSILFGVAACLAVALAIGLRSTGHGDPDPGGRRLALLRSLLVVVPADASIVTASESEPRWDQCQAGSETGFDSASVSRTFVSDWLPTRLSQFAERSARGAGWHLDVSTTQGLIELRWQRMVKVAGKVVVANGSLSQARLGTGSIAWSLLADAPPALRPLGSC